MTTLVHVQHRPLLPILLALSGAHLLNDLISSMIPAMYPLFKEAYRLDFTQVGLITLVGLIAKNGILIVEFANHLQETGKSKLEAIVGAAGTRLRPILMTTAATVCGHFPLVLAKGPGAGARNSIGIMLVSGMIIGTAFTLFVVPSIYMLVAKRHSAIEDDEESPISVPGQRTDELVAAR